MRQLSSCVAAIGLILTAAVAGAAEPAASAPALKWQFDATTGRIELQRGGDAPLWRGEHLAEIAYWDAAGKERRQLLSPDAGWKLEQTTAAGATRIVARQADLGLTLAFEFASHNDVLGVKVPAADVAEQSAARLKALRLLPRFGAACEGDTGYLAIAQQSGVLCRFRDKKPGEHPISIYQSICQCPMPLWGIVRGRSALAGIITGGQFDARAIVSTNWGPRQQYAVDPSFALRAAATEPRLADDLAVEYHLLADADADWQGIARRYRAYNVARRGVQPLRQRVAASPGLAYSAGAMEVRLRLGVKPVPYEIKEQTPENEPPVRVFLDFGRVRQIFDEFHKQGIRQAEFCLVGWNRGGHDGRYPQLFPVEPALGGEAELRKTIQHGQALGYQVLAHDCYYGAYRIAENWSEDYLRKDASGKPAKGGVWGGGQSYNICLCQAEALFLRPTTDAIRALGFGGAHYSDVLSIIGPRPCYDPRHPQSRRQDAEAVNRILAHLRGVFGSVQSEGGLDFAAPVLDRALYIDCDKWLPLDKRPYFDQAVPLFEMVYHGTLLYNLSTGVINTLPGETGYLKTIEYGALPLACFYGHFLLDTSKNWMGSRDYRFDDQASLEQAVAGLRRVFDDVERLKHLQLELLEGHRKLDAEVFETRYGNGQRVVVNYGQTAFRLPGGDSVAPRAYRLLPADK